MTITVPFPVEPQGIDAAGKGALLFVPAIANIKAPTMAELAAGENVSCKFYEWNPKGEQNKVGRSRYCSKGENESLGKAKYQADNIQYDYDPQDPEGTEGDYTLYAKMVDGTKGFIVDRRGIDYDEPWAASQWIDVYPVELGIQNRVKIDGKEEGQKLSIDQAVAIYSDPAFDAKIAA